MTTHDRPEVFPDHLGAGETARSGDEGGGVQAAAMAVVGRG
jgi:hypothetical protein